MKASRKKVAALAMVALIAVGSAQSAFAAPNIAPVNFQSRISTVLSQLVANNTITQAQSDAITAAFKAAAPVAPMAKPNISNGQGDGDKDGRMGHGGFGINSAARVAVITSTLGITAQALQDGLKSGKTLAQIAGANTQALITALVNFESTQIDSGVTSGMFTAAQATAMKANLTTRVTNEVNGVFGHRGGAGKHSRNGMATTPQANN